MTRPADPQTPEEWQAAVNLAEFILLLDSAKKYGLIETDMAYNVERALALRQAGAARGYVPVEYEPDPPPPRRKRGRPRKVR